MFDITGHWSIAALDLGVQYITAEYANKGAGCRFMEAYDGWGKRKKRPPKTERRKDKQKRRARLRLHLG